MSRFVTNVNEYLSVKKIKHTYVSSCSGIDAKKLIRILTGVQEVTETDMDKIAAVLGHTVDFFLQENFWVEEFNPQFPFDPASYSEGIEKPLAAYITLLVEFLQNVDVVLSADKFSSQHHINY